MALVDPPHFSFDLNFLGGDISTLPGLESWLKDLVHRNIIRCATERHGSVCQETVCECASESMLPVWPGICCSMVTNIKPYVLPRPYVLRGRRSTCASKPLLLMKRVQKLLNIGFSKLGCRFMGPFFHKMSLAQAVCAASTCCRW